MNENIRIFRFSEASLVDGPGIRTVAWVQGCSIHCDGCQNTGLWPRDAGHTIDGKAAGIHMMILNEMGLCKGNQQYTVTGGEPFDQPGGLADMLKAIRQEQPMAHIVAYTGRTWEELMDRPEYMTTSRTPTYRALSQIDVLVDGPYISEQDDDMIQYRGSRNQRVIDVQASLKLAGMKLAGTVVTTPSWDKPTITITNGTMTMAGGLADKLMLGGEETAKCGEAERD